MNSIQQKVKNYYKNFESFLGYKFITSENKHFGYHPNPHKPLSEKDAQEKMQDLLIENLGLRKNSSFAKASHVAEALRDKSAGKQKVLDAGCGYGIVACYVAEKTGAEIFGIDLNYHELKKAKERAKKLSLEKQISFEQMDYTYTTFPSNFFDAIYTMETLSHSPNIEKTLKEFLRILQVGGRIALFEYTLAEDKKFTKKQKKMLDLVISGSAMMGLKEFRHDSFPKVLQKVGFVNVSERNVTSYFEPSMRRFFRLAKIPYFFIKLFSLQKYFVNTTWAVTWYSFIKKNLWRYCIFTAQKK